MMTRIVSAVLAFLMAGPMLLVAGNAEADEERLAIQGYDPVAYFTIGEPTVGNRRFEYEWDDAVYRFASDEHLAMFSGNPDRYAPRYGNLCTASLSRGQRVESDPHNWLIHEGQLYLFGAPSGPGLMRKDSEDMKAKADTNYVRLAE
jgi:hypothetical protein